MGRKSTSPNGSRVKAFSFRVSEDEFIWWHQYAEKYRHGPLSDVIRDGLMVAIGNKCVCAPGARRCPSCSNNDIAGDKKVLFDFTDGQSGPEAVIQRFVDHQWTDLPPKREKFINSVKAIAQDYAGGMYTELGFRTKLSELVKEFK